ncbi:MAG: hypothetical protein RMA76_12020 [Deltaproteobacteria bacterium]|jgi:hypothetical protein
MRWLKRIFVVVLLLGAAGFAGYRIYRGDPVRTYWCRLAPCTELDGYDALCRAASIAELADAECPARALPTLVAEDPDATPVREALTVALDRPAPYPALEAQARAAGAPDWRCPPLSRVVTSTCAR